MLTRLKNTLDPQPEFSVRFNRKCAWTTIYADREGEVLFVFEIGEDPKTVILHRDASIDDRNVEETDANRPRLVLAFERTKQYLASCGYKVDDYAPEANGMPLPRLQNHKGNPTG